MEQVGNNHQSVEMTDCDDRISSGGFKGILVRAEFHAVKVGI